MLAGALAAVELPLALELAAALLVELCVLLLPQPASSAAPATAASPATAAGRRDRQSFGLRACIFRLTPFLGVGRFRPKLLVSILLYSASSRRRV